MPYYKFGQNDIFRNQIETHPQCDFHFHNGVAYFNQTQPQLGEMDPTPMVASNADPDWDDVVLLLNMDTEVSGVPIDLSTEGTNSPHTVTNVGGHWATSTTTAKAGFGASGDFTHVDAQLTVPPSDDFKMEAGDFTIEGWVYATSSAFNGGIFQIADGQYFSGETNSISFGFWISNKWVIHANNYHFATTHNAWTNNTWYHFALVKESNNIRLYIDGVAVTWTQTNHPSQASAYSGINAFDTRNYTCKHLSIGHRSSTIFTFPGFLDDFRVTKGVARYTGASFTLPTAPYPLPVVAPSTSHIPQNVTHVPSGYLSLYELNIDRKLSDHDYDAETETGDETMIYPFITKSGSLTSFKTVSTSTFQSFNYGTIMTGSYPMSASVTTEHYYESGSSVELVNCYGDVRRHIRSLKNTLNNYLYLSREYSYENYDTEEMRLVNIPSIFYGSHIEKGTVELKLFYKGELVAKLSDPKKNGELIQTYPETVEHCGPDAHPDYGKVAGVILYTEGFILLTGKWDMDLGAGNYVSNPGGYWLTCPTCEAAQDPGWNQPFNPVILPPRWIYFASLGDKIDWSCNEDPVAAEAAGDPSVTLNPDFMWALNFNGTNFVPVLTMLAHAPIGELNHSNNPTFIEHGQIQTPNTNGTEYVEKDKLTINNTMKSPYNDPNGNFRKQTWISKIGIYDEDKNLVGIAKLATPIRKTEEREFTFKLKLDF